VTIHDVGSSPVGSSDPADAADADLVLRSRSGDPDAFGELWRRHYPSGVAVARAVSSNLDADDLVQESFTRIYRSIVRGGGPTGSFRAYLFTSIRNTAASWGRARRETAIDALDALEDPASSDQATSDALDRGLTHQAFRSLPERWQEVLWYSEIEQMKPAEIAPLLGMKPTAVAQLAFRAREGLREAWIQAHLRTVADGSMCQWTIDRLGAYSRHSLGQRDRVKVEAHLHDCTPCAIVASEAHEVSSRLALVLLPLTLGATGAAGYLAALHGASAPAIALAAMPSTVMQGAVTVAPAAHATTAAAGGATGAGSAGATAGTTAFATASGSGATAGLAGAAGATGVGAASTAAAGTLFTSVGAMAGIATAGIAVVTTVVAGAVGIHALAKPAEVERSATSVTQEQVTADAAADAESPPPVTTTDPLIVPPGSDAGSSGTDGTVDGAAPIGDPVAANPESADEQPASGGESTESGDTGSAGDQGSTENTTDAQGDAGGQGNTGTKAKPDAPSKAGIPSKAGAQDDTDTQGDAATTGSPGVTGSNGKGNDGVPPGQAAKSTKADGDAAAASTPAVVSTATLAFASSASHPSADGSTTITVTVTGVPGAALELRVRGRVAASGVIADDGTATLVFQPTAKELSTDARVDIRYTDGKGTGAPLAARLSDLV
jgi:RNA polymerase sigma factor (sigma-70 family)